MGIDELTPPPTGQILVTNNGTVVMSFGTLVRISNGDMPVMPLEKVKNGLGLKESEEDYEDGKGGQRHHFKGK